MSHSLHLNDYELRQLDCLVDGTLSKPQYTQLLQRLAETEDGWKLCAIAFLEEQALSQDLQAMNGTVDSSLQDNHCSVSNTSPNNTLPNNVPLRLLSDTVARTSQIATSSKATSNKTDVVHRADTATCSQSSSRRSRSWLVNLVPIAISTFLAFGIGWQSSRSFAPAAKIEKDGNSSSWLTQKAQQTGNEVAAVDPPTKSVLLTEEEAADLIRAAAFSNLDAELATAFPKDSYERQTYRLNPHVEGELERHQTMMPVESDDGISKIVPVEHIRFRPIAIHGF